MDSRLSGLVNLDISTLFPPDTSVIPPGYCSGNTTLSILDLSTLPISVIESECFRYLLSLTELRFSKVLTRIMYGSFRGLISIMLIDLSNCNMLRVLEDDTFVGAHSLRGLILPDGLLEIGTGACRELTSLENLTIPASVMTIGSRAFGGCSRLRQVILNGNTQIDPNAFRRCHPSLTFVHQSSSKVEGCSLQPRQAASGGGVMGVAVVEPSMHPDLPSLLQSSSEVEGCRLQPGQAAAGGGVMGVAVDVGEPSMHPDSPFRFPCYMGRHAALKGKLKFGQDAEGFVCQITYEEFVADTQIVILPCGHAFSVIGMSDWYKNHQSCPSCNGELP
jgi:hypothetical protein